jgi:alpha-tubulin suppressor-like RCC1 family protein/fibronectin type 3 domain-containing protein
MKTETRAFRHRGWTGLLLAAIAGFLAVVGLSTPKGLQVVSAQTPAPANASVSTRGAQTVFVHPDGSVWGVGVNANGSLGDGSLSVRTGAVRMQVASGHLAGAVKAACGTHHTAVLKADGTVWTVGLNSSGQLGIGSTVRQTKALQVATAAGPLTGVSNLVSGGAHSLALSNMGEVWAWGANNAGQLGINSLVNQVFAVKVPGLSGVVHLAAGDSHSYAVKSDGTVWAFGNNTNGQLGNNSTTASRVPVQVLSSLGGPLTGVTLAAAGLSHGVFLKSDGSVWAVGLNSSGQLGDGTATQRLAAVRVLGSVAGFEPVRSVSAGDAHTVFLQADGSVWAVGSNSNGQLGDGTRSNRTRAVKITAPGAVSFIAAGAVRSFAVRENGELLAWGDNMHGTLGLPEPGFEWSWTTLPEWPVSTRMALGAAHSLWVKADGSLWALGRNNYGQLGNGLNTDSLAAVRVQTSAGDLGGIGDAAAGTWHSLALGKDGRVWAWGHNGSGRLGDGTTSDRSKAVAVLDAAGPLTGVSGISAGDAFGLALRQGSVLAWGANSLGQLGDNTTTARSKAAPVQTATGALTGVTAAAAGASHGAALKADGTVWVWGANTAGQLGLGNTTSQRLAVQVPGVSDALAVSAGAAQTYILRAASGGTVWGAGQNNAGQLADGTTTNRSGLVQVQDAAGALTGLAWMRAGSLAHHAAAGRLDGASWIWGLNDAGQLGTGNFVSSLKAVLLPGGVRPMALGDKATFALWGDHDWVATGSRYEGHWGDGVRGFFPTPTPVVGMSFRADAPDSDGDGVPDWLELARGTNPNAADSDGDGIPDASDLFPNDYYNNQAPTLEVVSGGAQTGAPGALLPQALGVRVTRNGVPLGNAPVRFSMNGVGLCAGADNTNPAGWLGVRTDANGRASSFLTLPPTEGVHTVRAEAGTASVNISATAVIVPTPPLFSVPGGTYATQRSVAVSTPTPGARIHYTLDGSEPGPSSSSVESGGVILVDRTATLKARTIRANGMASAVSTAAYTIGGMVSVGGGHTLALRSDGSVWAWGSNEYGQLGDGTKIDRSSPVQVSGLSGVTAVAAGDRHSVAVKCDGTVWAWGYNGSGQLGDGSQTWRTAPVQVGTLTGVVAVSAGANHTVALKSDGTLWAWGFNDSGQLGDGTKTYRLSPVQVSGLSGVVSVSAGGAHTVALKADGRLWAWGADSFGQISGAWPDPDYYYEWFNDPQWVDEWIWMPTPDGDGGNWVNYGYWQDYWYSVEYYGRLPYGSASVFTTPVLVGAVSDVTAASAGEEQTVAATSTGAVFTLGYNRYYDDSVNSPTNSDGVYVNGASGQVPGLSSVAAVSAGRGWHSSSSVAVKTDGTVWEISGAWVGEVTQVGGISGAVAVSSGYNRSVALTGDGRLLSWGDNSSAGKLGLGWTGDDRSRLTPTQVSGITGAVSIATGSGSRRAAALKRDGTVWAWGNNSYGALGDGTTSARPSPVQASGLTGVVSVLVGEYSSFALRNDGTLWAWGGNGSGQLGDGTTTQRSSPVQVSGLTGVVSVVAGRYHAYALKNDGTLWAWGYNYYGQLGDGTTTQRSSPVQVSGLTGVASVVAGEYHAYALKNDGTLWAWGGNGSGQLGDGTTTQRSSPVQVSGLTGVASVVAGGYHAHALKNDGTLWAWGYNGSGQVGDGTTTNRATPVQVSGLTGVVSVTAGHFNHTYALKNDGTVWAWGSNSIGELGDGTTTQRTTPVQVSGLTGVVSVVSGRDRAYALQNDGTVWAWGRNYYGELGDGTTIRRTSPVQVSGLGGVVAVAADDYRVFALKNDGTLWAWGDNERGALGVETRLRSNQVALRLIFDPADSNLNSVPDAWELARFGNLTTPMAEDSDNDGLTNIEEFLLGTNPNSSNTDGDLLTDSADPAPTEPSPEQAPVTVSQSGNNQQGQAGGILAQALEVRLTTNGAPTPGMPVVAYVTGGGALMADPSSNLPAVGAIVIRTDAQGVARVFVQLPPADGTAITVTFGGLPQPVVFQATAIVDTDNNTLRDSWEIQHFAALGQNPAADPDGDGLSNLQEYQQNSNPLDFFNGQIPELAVISGQDQTGTVGTPLPQPFTVRVTRNGAPLSNAPVSFTAPAPGLGTTAGASPLQSQITVRTNAAGDASCYFTLPAVEGTHTIQVAAGTATASFYASGYVVPAAPVFSFPAGSYATARSVTVSSATAGARIHYTLDGSEPTASSASVESWGVIPVTVSATLKARAVRPFGPLGEVTTAVYRITGIAAAGAAHTVALKGDGTLWAWGLNSNGQLGDNTTISRPGPVNVLSGVAAVAAGNAHTVALKNDGSVWAWGLNTNGQLGDGTTTQRIAPVKIIALSGVVAVAANGSQSAALKNDGTVWTWGLNTNGQLGDNTTTQRTAPVRAGALTGVTAIAVGTSHMVALKNDGTLWAWGLNTNGQLGDATLLQRTAPVQVSGFTGATAVAAGGAHTLALKNDGAVWAWGLNSSGQLGDNTVTQRTAPVRIGSLTGVGSVAAGSAHSAALRNDGTTAFWGANSSGQLGDGTATALRVPWTLPGVTNAVAVVAGTNHTAVLRADGTLTTFGANTSGQLGDGTLSQRNTAVQGVALNGVAAVSAGGIHTAALRGDGTLRVWGGNTNGQLGDNTAVLRRAPVTPAGLTGIASVSAGNLHTVALRTDGTLRAWGFNGNGQLGDNTVTQRAAPITVPGITGVVEVSAGHRHTAAVKNDGTLWAWGLNTNGQIGDGSLVQRNAPVQVSGLTGMASVSAGVAHTVALKNDGSVWAWGLNTNGQLGNGATTQSAAPVQVTGFTGAIAVSAGATHSVALKNDGTVWAWGLNSNGQLGDNTITQRTAPVQVTGLTGVVAVSANAAYTLALKSDGTLWAWGLNSSGQLGDGTFTQRNAPVRVAGLTGVVAVSAGNLHAAALLADGTVRTWGQAGSGQFWLGPVLKKAALRLVPDASDANQNAVADAWEQAQFGNTTTAVTLDPDLDGLSHIQEAELGTNPASANADADLFSDLVDPAPLVAGTEPLPLFTQGSGNNQRGVAGTFLAQPLETVVTLAGQPMANTPVMVRLTAGAAKLAPRPEAASANGHALIVRTDAQGRARVFVQLPAAGGALSTVAFGALPQPIVFQATAVTPPAAPAALTAVPGNARVSLAWDAVPGATGYKVQRSTISGSGYADFAGNTVSTTALVDTGLLNGTPYFYVVVALNGDIPGAPSIEASATPTAPPPTVSGLSAVPGNAQVRLSWTESPGATGYRVQRSTVDGSGYADFPGNTLPGTELLDTGLVNGTPYFYVVYAVNIGGSSPVSAQISATPVAPPSAPVNLAAVPGNAQVILSWDAVPNATLYKVQRSTVSGSGYADFPGNTTVAPTFTQTGLTNGTTYFYVVNALNAGGSSPASAQVAATPVAPPTAPTGLTAAPGNTQVSLSWTALAGATSYKVQRSTVNGSGYADFAGNTTTGTALVNTGLTNGTTYYYVVTASNAGGSSPASAQVAATPVAPPTVPTGLTAAPGNARVSLSWTAVSGATSYKLRRSTVSGSGYADFAGNTATGTTLVNTGLTNGTPYYYVVAAVNAGGSSAWSAQVAATPVAPPVAPTGVTAVSGNAQARIAWTAVAGATSYKVQRSTVSGSGYADFAGNTTTALTLTHTGLTNGTVYYYVVYAVNAGGSSAASAQVTARPVAPPVAPTGFTAAPGNTQVSLSWTAVPGATSYKVQRSTVSGSGYADFAGNTTTGTALVNTGLTNGTTYYYVVTASNDGGTSPGSAQAAATPVAPPATPAGLAAVAGNARVTLSWTAVPGAASYKLQRSIVSGSGYADFPGNTPTATTLTDTGLTNGTPYFYVVCAVNAGGASPFSAQVSATPSAVPAAPSGVTATAGNAQVTLSWTAVPDATSYKVQRSATSGSGYADFAGNTTTGTTLVNTGLANGTPYYYVVSAVNAAGTGVASAQVAATPLDVLPAPAGVVAVPGHTQVTLSWQAAPGAATYKVRRSVTAGSGHADFPGNTTSATTFTNTGLTNGTAYYYVVQALSPTGASVQSAEAAATPLPVPAVPAGLAAAPGDARVTLSWSAVPGAASYRVRRSTTAGAGYADFPGNTTPAATFTDTGLTNGTTYFYVVAAVNTAGTSDNSAQASATPVAPPAAPTGLAASPGNTQVTLSWSASPGAASYKVQRSVISGSGYADFAGNTTTGLALTDTGLANGTTYFYVVRAVNAGGSSLVSAEASATPVAPPAAPTGLAAAPGNSQVTLSWSASPGAASYKIQRSVISGSGYADFAGNTTTGLTLTNTGLANGTPYFYVVTAVNAGGSSPASAEVPATPVAPPVAPTGLTAAPGNAQVTLSWSAVAGATSYKIQRSTTNGSGYADFAGNTTTALTFTNTGLTNGTPYYYVVFALNAGGTSPASAQATATPVAPPAAGPASLTATPGNAQVTLGWPAVPGATSYKVQRSTTSGSGYADFAGNTTPGLTLTNTGLTNGTTYYYVVFAVNAGGTSPASAQATAKPVAPPAAGPASLTTTPGNAQVTLNWPAVTGATSYKVQRSTTNGGPYADFTGNTTTGLTLTNTGLTNGTAYYYVVFALNAGGTSPASAQATAKPVAPPATGPASLTAAPGNAQVTLSWPAVTGATSYKVQRSTTDGSGYADFTGNTTPGLTLTNTGLTNGTPYYYIVFAVNAGGTSPKSVQATATPVAPPAAAPTSLTAVPGNAQVTLSWSAVPGATGYIVRRSTVSGSGYVDLPATTTSLSDTGLVNGTTYFYVVVATNAGGLGPVSAEISAAPVAPPAAPTGLAAAPGDGQIALSWNAVPGAAFYRVRRSTTNGSGHVDFSGNTVTGLTFTNTGLTNGTPYYYVVVASNAGGESLPSAQAGATPIAPPAAPTGLAAVPGNAQVSLSWNAVSGATGYIVQRSTTSGGGYADFPGNTTAETTLVNTGLTNGTPYYYKVAATNAGGPGPFSAEAAATPVTPLLPPPNPVRAVALNGGAALYWDAVPGATAYKIRRSVAGNDVEFTSTEPAYMDQPLGNETPYSYTVRTVNEFGPGPDSAPVTVTPRLVLVFQDTNADGVDDAWAVQHFGTVNFATSGDADGDGLSNSAEYGAGTNPNNSDSDGDGFDDGEEVDDGSDPKDPNSKPLRPPTNIRFVTEERSVPCDGPEGPPAPYQLMSTYLTWDTPAQSGDEIIVTEFTSPFARIPQDIHGSDSSRFSSGLSHFLVCEDSGAPQRNPRSRWFRLLVRRGNRLSKPSQAYSFGDEPNVQLSCGHVWFNYTIGDQQVSGRVSFYYPGSDDSIFRRTVVAVPQPCFGDAEPQNIKISILNSVSAPAIFGKEYPFFASANFYNEPTYPGVSAGVGSDLYLGRGLYGYYQNTVVDVWNETYESDEFGSESFAVSVNYSGTIYIPKVSLKIYSRKGKELWGDYALVQPNNNNDEGRAPVNGVEPRDNDNNVADPSKDPDLVKVVLEGPTQTQTGKVQVVLPSGIRAFTESGQLIESPDLELDLANPTGQLAGLKQGPLTVYLEAENNAQGGEFSIAQYSRADKDGKIHLLQKEYVNLLPVEMMVDGNRDGEMSFTDAAIGGKDATSQEKPYRFWLNNDHDEGKTVDKVDWEEDDYPGAPDSSDNELKWKRDLEDLTRLWISFNGITDMVKSEGFQLQLEWKPIDGGTSWPADAGTPAIKIFKAVEGDGGRKYLEDETWAQQQIGQTYRTALGQAGRGAPLILPLSQVTLANLTETNPNIYLLFEGVTAGKGQLVLNLIKNGQKIGEYPPLHIDLRDIKNLYERWTVDPEPSQPQRGGSYPLSAAERSGKRLPSGSPAFAYGADDPEEKKYVLYVHGWNMTPVEKEYFAETAYKRLFLQGYKGRVGVFQWPTTHSFDPEKNKLDPLNDPTNYDRGERRAWQSALPLRGLLAQLNQTYPGQVHVLAHSMGNVVMGEALRLQSQHGSGQIAKTYVASQGALPAHCYDGTIAQGIPFWTNLQWDYDHPDIPNGTRNYGPATPNIYRNWLAFNGSAVGRRVNFYNVSDYALTPEVWQFNQIAKPDWSDRPDQPWNYFYGGDPEQPPLPTGFYKSEDDLGRGPTRLDLGDRADVKDRYEIMAFAAEPRSKALGGMPGILPESVNLVEGGIWPEDDSPQSLRRHGNYSAHKWHSAQFRSSNMRQKNYWQELLGNRGFGIKQATTP